MVVAYCSRDCNRVAHDVAPLGYKCPYGTDLFWEGTQSGIKDLVTSDITESLV